MLYDGTKRAGPGLSTVACHLPATQGQCDDGTITKYSSDLTAAPHGAQVSQPGSWGCCFQLSSPKLRLSILVSGAKVLNIT